MNTSVIRLGPVRSKLKSMWSSTTKSVHILSVVLNPMVRRGSAMVMPTCTLAATSLICIPVAWGEKPELQSHGGADGNGHLC